MTELDKRALNSAQSTDPEAEREKYKAQIQQNNPPGPVLFEDDWGAPITFSDCMKDRPPRKYAVAGLFELPSLNIVYGAPGSYKSFLMADLVTCITHGKNWAEPLPNGKTQSYATTKLNVMVLDNDNKKADIEDRYKALLAGHGLTENNNLEVYSFAPFRADDDEQFDRLKVRLLKFNSEVLIVDNLGNISGAVEENNATMAQIMARFRKLSEDTGAAIVLIHHPRKGGINGGRAGDTLRGHSSIEASLDLALLAQREPDSEFVTLLPTKVRGQPVKPLTFYYSMEQDKDGRLQSARFFGYPCEIETEGQLFIWAVSVLRDSLEKEPQITQTHFIELLQQDYERGDLSKTKALALINKLENTGKVKTTRGARNAKFYNL